MGEVARPVAALSAAREAEREEDEEAAPPPVATPFSVSTITAIGSVCTSVDLPLLFERLPLDCDCRCDCRCDAGREREREERGAHAGDLLEELGGGGEGGRIRTLSVKYMNRVRKAGSEPVAVGGKVGGKEGGGGGAAGVARPGVGFGNQATLVLMMPAGGGIAAEERRKRLVNAKVFRNGSVQLTGVKRVEDGERAIGHIVSLLRHLAGVAADPSRLRVADYRVCLINTDFDVGIPVKRDWLLQCVRRNYRTECSYEPCVYPGVKIKFMWNDAPSTLPDGVCRCGDEPCSGRGDGHGENACRKVTIAVFHSGKCIITGAHTLRQVQDAYAFLVHEVVARHHAEVRVPAAARQEAAGSRRAPRGGAGCVAAQ